jgi:hypothetical protein
VTKHSATLMHQLFAIGKAIESGDLAFANRMLVDAEEWTLQIDRRILAMLQEMGDLREHRENLGVPVLKCPPDPNSAQRFRRTA